ncbi:MAG: type 1 glutamine amidotransferase [Nocardioides sp.]
MTLRLLVIQHQDTCPPALLGRWLVEAGLTLDVRRPDQGEQLPPDLTGHDALMVLGGTMDSFDEAGHPWLGDTIGLLGRAVHEEVPTLGVCLGHQLLARACGGVVARNPRGRQLGLLPMGWTEAALHDALVNGLAVPGPQARGLHWNQDIVVEVPSSSVVLARTPLGEPQVVRFGERAWGIQAHPEASEDVVRWWADDAAPDVVPVQADRVVAEVGAAAEELRATWQPLATAFADLVGVGSESRA